MVERRFEPGDRLDIDGEHWTVERIDDEEIDAGTARLKRESDGFGMRYTVESIQKRIDEPDTDVTLVD